MIFYLVTFVILVFYFFYSNSKSRWEASVVLFTAFIMQGFIIPAEQEFLGFMDQRSVVAIILIYTAYSSKIGVIPYRSLDNYKKWSLFLGIFIIIILGRYIEVKNGILFGDVEFLQVLKRILRDSINLFAVYHIFKRLYNPSTHKGLENGLLLGLVITLISMVFPDFFINRGFALNTGAGEDYSRLTGFLGLNANNTARIFNVIYGYILAKTEITGKFNKKQFLFTGLLLLGLLLVASRTGLVIFVAITLIYLYRNSKKFTKTLRNSVLIILLSVLLFNFFGDLLSKRVEQYQTGEQDSLESRITYWGMYLNDIKNNPEYLIIGNLGAPTYHRSVHNTYIHYTFYSGAISIIIILSLFWKIFKYKNKYKNNYLYYTPSYSLLALMIGWITGAGSIDYWFIFIIGASSGIPPILLRGRQNIKMQNQEMLNTSQNG